MHTARKTLILLASSAAILYAGMAVHFARK